MGWGCRRILQYRRWIFGHLSKKQMEVEDKLYAGGSRRTLFSQNKVSTNHICTLIIILVCFTAMVISFSHSPGLSGTALYWRVEGCWRTDDLPGSATCCGSVRPVRPCSATRLPGPARGCGSGPARILESTAAGTGWQPLAVVRERYSFVNTRVKFRRTHVDSDKICNKKLC